MSDRPIPAGSARPRKPMPDGVTRTGKRRRSEERARTAQFRVRLTPQEKTAMEKAAAEAGLDLAALIRREILGTKGPRTRNPRPSPDVAALAAMATQLGYVGNNLNQLTRLANMGDLDRPAELDRVLAFLLGVLAEVRATMRPAT